MILKAFALIMLWSLPWQTDYLLHLHAIEFDFRCDIVWAAYARAGNTIIVCPEAAGRYTLKKAIIHESQHHMQWTECPGCDPEGWDAFERTVVQIVKKGDYTDHQRNSTIALVGVPVNEPWYNELHAELPNILELDIPEPLCPWYPWFCEGKQ